MTAILYALLIVGGVSLAAGLLLAVSSHFMHVEVDETVACLRACLPGVNCGACGYTGCDEYAKALAEGKAAPNLCIPGSTDTAAKIGEVLGIEVVEEPRDLVAVVACGGDYDANPDKVVYDGIQTCHAATMLYGGQNACPYGCLGCGDCAAVCPVEAISVVNGVAKVDTTTCIGCGMCVRTCPKGIIRLVLQSEQTLVKCSNHEKGAVARKNCSVACIGCKKCEKTCPEGAITVVDNLATIDYEKCTKCGLCVAGCPTHCLHTVNLYTNYDSAN